MSQRDNFSGGFLLGAIVGGIAGGVLGAVLAAKKLNETEASLLNPDQPTTKLGKSKSQSLKAANGHREIETARRSLEDKIAQLNDAIDDVRQQLGGLNGNTAEETEGRSSLAKD
jgi:gas vesicle protein